MDASERRLALSKHRFTVPSVANVLTSLGLKLAEEEMKVAKTLEASLNQTQAKRHESPQRSALSDAVERIRDSLRYRVMLEALLKQEVTPRDVHVLLNTGRKPRLSLGRIEGGSLLLSIDEVVALSVVWRLSCEPFLQIKPERRRAIASVIDARLLDRVLRGDDAFLYYLDDRVVIVRTQREEARLGSRALVSFSLPLPQFIERVIETASNEARREKQI